MYIHEQDNWTDFREYRGGMHNPISSATFQGKPVNERILKLDAERYKRGDIPLDHLLVKYLSYLIK